MSNVPLYAILRRIVLVWACAVFANASEVVPDGPREFTDVFGRKLRAEIVGLNDTAVMLKRVVDGAEFTLPLDKLSDRDREWIASNLEAIHERVTPLPETAFTRALRGDFRVLKQNALGLEAVTERMWMRTRYFLIVYGVPAQADVVRSLGVELERGVAGMPVAVLWLGPSDRNGAGPPPVSGSDLKVASWLPPGFAVVSAEAVGRDGAIVDAAIEAIGMEVARDDDKSVAWSADRPPPQDKLHDFWMRRALPVREYWNARLAAKLPAYWPDVVFRTPYSQGVRGFLVDREGRQVVLGKRTVAGEVREVVQLTEKVLSANPETLVAVERAKPVQPVAAATAPRVFRYGTNQTVTATVVSITTHAVVLKNVADGNEMKLPFGRLHADDQLFLTVNRAAWRGAERSRLPMRVVSGAEVAKMKRFAADVLLEGKTGDARVWRLDGRPVLKVESSLKTLDELAQAFYGDFCDAAGFMEEAASDAPEIALFIGSMNEINEHKKRLVPDLSRSQTWMWAMRRDQKDQRLRVYLFLVAEADDAESRHRMVKLIGAAFGLPGTGKEFPESLFHVKSDAERASELDRQLVRLLYEHLPQYATRDTVLSAVEQHWAAMVGPAVELK